MSTEHKPAGEILPGTTMDGMPDFNEFEGLMPTRLPVHDNRISLDTSTPTAQLETPFGNDGLINKALQDEEILPAFSAINLSLLSALQDGDIGLLMASINEHSAIYYGATVGASVGLIVGGRLNKGGVAMLNLGIFFGTMLGYIVDGSRSLPYASAVGIVWMLAFTSFIVATSAEDRT